MNTPPDTAPGAARGAAGQTRAMPRDGGRDAAPAPPAPVPPAPVPPQSRPRRLPPVPSAPILPAQSREDTDVGWGDYAERDDNDRLLRDRPPHWDNA